MPLILGLDTGTKKTGFVIIDSATKKIFSKKSFGDLEFFHGDIANQDLLDLVYDRKYFPFDYVAGEMLEGRGNAAGNETYEAILWLGRFIEASSKPFFLVYPRHIRTFHTGRPNSNDKQVSEGILKRYRDNIKVWSERGNKELSEQVLLKGDEIAAYAVATYVAEKHF